MPAISRFPIKTPFSQFSKRDDTQSQGGGDSDVKSPVVVVGLVIAALTLLAAVIPLLRCPRFRSWVSTISIRSSNKKALGIVTLPNPPPTTTTARDDSSATPVAQTTIPGGVLIYNDYSNAHLANTHYSSPYRNKFNIREGDRVPQEKESLGPRIPERVVTWPFA